MVAVTLERMYENRALKLGLISGYSGLERILGGGIANESIQLEEDRTLIKNRKLSYIGTAERNIKFI